MRGDQGELLAQRRLGQAQRSSDCEPVGRDIEQHERAVIATAGEIEAGDELKIGGRQRRTSLRRPVDFAWFGTARAANFFFLV